ncbi:MAG: DNA repair protein RadA [Treponema sp.]|nr:DNA repair protein RadA [Treponema sp.]
MKKPKGSLYRCTSCGREEAKWLGRCPECGEWNSFVETAVSKVNGKVRSPGEPPQSLPLSSVDPLEGTRLLSGIPELDRVLGGGIMKRSAILVGGEPGVGKSTLLLQAAAAADTKGRILYVSGEESAGQVKMRANRLGLETPNIELFCSGVIEEILKIIENLKPVLIMIDSAQTLFSAEAGSSPGTVNQMKHCAWELVSWIKEHDSALFLTAHVTKDGLISGPKSLEHLVDTVLYFEDSTGSNDLDTRFLRATKNRFGSVDEIGIFTMGERGLSAVEDPSLLFLVRRDPASGSQGDNSSGGDLPPGISTAAVLEGSRTLLVEIQALSVPAKGSMSRVFSDRIDSARVSRVAAVIEKHLGLRLSDQDLYVNVAGGIRINEVGVELALACALYSARTGLALPATTAIAGELTLAGEVRPLRRLSARLRTARNLGFHTFLGPVLPSEEGADADPAQSSEGFLPARDIKGALRALFPHLPS